MKLLTTDNVLSVFKSFADFHFQECSTGKDKFLADTDHETIDELLTEFKDYLTSEFEGVQSYSEI